MNEDKAQEANEKSQEDTSNAQVADEKKQDESSQNAEAAKYRRKLRDTESALAELQAQMEELQNSKLSEAEKQQKAQEKYQQKVAELERAKVDAERKLMSSRAVLKHSLPEALSEMLQGKDEDEIDDHAKSLASELDKWARSKYKPVAPDLEGGNRNTNANGKPTAEEKQRQQREYAKRF